jgi:replicative DNA helicase
MTEEPTAAVPYSIYAEKTALCCAMNFPQVMGELIEAGIDMPHFYQPANQSLFRVIREGWDRGAILDPVEIVNRLRDVGELDRAGGPSYVAECYTYQPTVATLPRAIETLRKRLALREVLALAADARTKAIEEDPELVAEIIDGIESAAGKCRECLDPPKGGGESMEVEIAKVALNLANRIQGESETMGIGTGFASLDTLGVRLRPAEMFVIAARPSMGKTALMMNIVEDVVFRQELPALVFSAEMTRAAILERLLVSRLRIDTSQVRTLEKRDLLDINRQARTIGQSKLTVIDRAPITVGEIRAITRRRHKESPLGLVAIDYLQYVRHASPKSKDSREREVAEISAAIKALAKELSIPVLLLAQLNRGPESRTGSDKGVPRMSDLRESGAIEQDADIVGLLYRPGYYGETEDERNDGRARLIVAKHRNGQTGTAEMTWIAPQTRFADGAPAWTPPAPKKMETTWEDD